MKHKTVTLRLPVVFKERARKGAHGNFYTPRDTAMGEDAIAQVAKDSKKKIEGRFAIDIKIFTMRKGDIDNCEKSVLDGLQKGGLIENDKLCYEKHTWRYDSTKEVVDVTLTERKSSIR